MSDDKRTADQQERERLLAEFARLGLNTASIEPYASNERLAELLEMAREIRDNDRPSADDRLEELQPPERSIGDHVEAGIRATMGIVPIGGSIAELYHHLIGTPLERRQRRWMESIATAIKELRERKAVTLEDLTENEAFVSAAMRASQIAVRTHQAEKLDALRNAVLNVAAGTDVREDLQSTFIDAIDSLTPAHMYVLRFLRSPAETCEVAGVPVRTATIAGTLSSLITEVFHELSMPEEVVAQITRDLHARGWTNIDSLKVMMSASGLYAKRTTALGDQFLEFISEPTLDGLS